MDSYLHVITSLYVPPGARCFPPHVEAALKSHLASPLVGTISILTEADPELVERLCISLGHPKKCEVVACVHRPVFSELFDAASEVIRSSGGVAAVMNADISFADKESISRCMMSLRQASLRNPSCVFALTRHDHDGTDWRLCLHEANGMPNFLSADCWVFGSPICLPEADSYSLGQMNCDLMVNHDLAAAGHCVYNPCLDIRIFHHEADLKELDYYVAESRKDDAAERLWRFVASRGIPDYNIKSIPWIHSKWLDDGYRPEPFAIHARKIFVALPAGNLPKHIPALLGIETYARCHGYDLVLLAENQDHSALDPLLFIGRRNRNVYFVRLEQGFDHFASHILEHGYNNHAAIVFASDLRFMTRDLAHTAGAVVIDGRRWDRDDATRKLLPVHGYSPDDFRHRHPDVSFEDVFFPDDCGSRSSRCTLITSVFRSDDFLPSFLANCIELEGYASRIDHVFFLSAGSPLERRLLAAHVSSHPNTLLYWNREDPGLYACWNLGTQIAQTPYLSNANVDDLRAATQVRTLVDILDAHPDAAVAASAIVPFENYTGHAGGIDISEVWYADRAGKFGFEDLYILDPAASSDAKMAPHNMPHCMPVWRRSLHSEHGYFDERNFGTFADWEFWLRVTKAGVSGFLHPEPLSFYFVNPASHNRRGSQLAEFHARIVSQYLPHAMTRRSNTSMDGTTYPRKLNLHGRDIYYGVHRNSFNSIIHCLDPLHIGPDGIDFMPFVERYFVWGNEPGEAGSSDPRPLVRPWVGILHVPFDSPSWFSSSIHPETFFQTDLWQRSLEHCRGIICLSEDLQYDLMQYYPDLPSISLKHPTSSTANPFNLAAYLAHPRLVQVGDWLRQLQAIYRVHPCGHEKLILLKKHTLDYMNMEIRACGNFRNDSVRELDFVSNDEYDDILSTSVVLCMLYASAANNVVLECIVRATPIVINPLPSVVEYLGSDYPLYATNLLEAEALLLDASRIAAAHEALVRRRANLDLSYSGFMHSFASSDFYANL